MKKPKQLIVLTAIPLSLITSSCSIGQPSDSTSEFQTSNAVTESIYIMKKMDSTVETTIQQMPETEITIEIDTAAMSENNSYVETRQEESASVFTYQENRETDREIDIMAFINLDWIYEEGDAYPHLYRDDILAFDNHAYDIGAVPKHSYANRTFYFFIGSENRSLFGKEGFLYYRGRFKPNGIGETVVEYPHDVYSPCYEYIGDGSEIPYESDMIFTIPNATYHDYLDILQQAAEFTYLDIADFRFYCNNEHEYRTIADIPELLSVDDFDTVIDDGFFDISMKTISIPGNTREPFYIKIDWFGERHFTSENYEFLEIYPWDEKILNSIRIRIYWSDTQDHIVWNSASTSSSEAEETAGKSEFHITGKYICAASYFDNKYFVKYPEMIPCISFSDDGHCILFINYMGGACDMEGKYRVEGDKIYVKLDFANTIFEDTGTEYRDTDFMADEYVFSILDDDRIIIHRACYTVEANDMFVHVENET